MSSPDLSAAQVAQALLAGIGAEEEVGLGPQVRPVEQARQGQERRDGQAVVPDPRPVESPARLADADIGAEGEDGIGVGGE